MSQNDVADIGELRQRSVDDPQWFWPAVVEFLNIEFAKPYDKIVDTSDGIEFAKWFVGGKLNAADVCLRAASTRPTDTAIVWEGDDGEKRHWTWAELEKQTNGVAHLLRERGVKPGDVVGIYMPMVPEIVAAVLGVVKTGAVFLPLFSGYGEGAIESRLSHSGAVALITSDGCLRRGKRVDMQSVAQLAVENVSSVKTTVVFDRTGNRVLSANQLPWPEPIDTEETELVDSEHPLFIAYTSGTTGRPKAAVHVHGGFVVKEAEEVAFQTDATPNDVLFWFTDMGWIMGPWEVFGGLANGSALALFEGAPDFPDAGRLWNFCENAGVTILGASPTLIRSLMSHGNEFVRKADLSKLRILGSTGEPWNEDPWWWYFNEVGGGRCPVINLSGGTEVGACFLSPHPVEEILPMSLGGPALGMAVDVYDDDAKPVRGKVGELVCTAPWPSMTRGLLNDRDRYLETYWSRWPNVWVHGDWASIENGQWFLHGRSDDTIKIAGKRLGPSEAESAAVSHPAVVEAAAVGLPDQTKGESLALFVVLSPDNEITDELRTEIRAAVSDVLGKSFAPALVKSVNALPKTRNGKILRRAIRSVALGQDPGDMSSLEDPTTLDAIRSAE